MENNLIYCVRQYHYDFVFDNAEEAQIFAETCLRHATDKTDDEYVRIEVRFDDSDDVVDDIITEITDIDD